MPTNDIDGACKSLMVLDAGKSLIAMHPRVDASCAAAKADNSNDSGYIWATGSTSVAALCCDAQ
jgi:hypothetical protein